MNTRFPNQATTVLILIFVCLALAPLPAWGDWHTRLVKDMNPGIGNTAIFKSVNAGSVVYFITGNAYTGDYTLNCTDGTAANTYELSPVGRSQSWTTPDKPPLVSLNGGAVFARNAWGVLQLCRSNGMPPVTAEIMYLGEPDDFLNKLGNFITVGGQVFFTKGSGLLYRSDGTTSGTALVKDFSADGGMSLGSEFCGRNGLLYFSVTNAPSAGGGELWCSDGTPGGTTRIWQPGADYTITGLLNTPDGLYAAANRADFWDDMLHKMVSPRELWRITPESGAAQRVFYRDGYDNGVYGLASLNGQVYFTVFQTQQLWKTSGGAQASMVVDIPAPPGLTYEPTIAWLTVTDRALVFAAQTAEAGMEPWTSDGTAGGTHVLKDFSAGAQSSDFVFVPLESGDLFICVKDVAAGNWPFWKTDGTDAGTAYALTLQYSTDSAGACKLGDGYLLSYNTLETGHEPYFLYEGSFAITQQPLSVGAAALDSTVKFEVGVSEWARPWTQYQWMLNGAPIPDATVSELVLPSVQYAHSGLYTCRVVFNDGNSDTPLVSNAARLTVVAKIPAVNAAMRMVLSLLLCFTGGVAMVRTSARRKEHAGR